MSRPGKIAVTVVAIVRGTGPDARILLTRRPAGSHLAGFWELPGGKIEPGETPEEAACREVREEVGLTLAEVEPLIVTEHAYPDRVVRLHACMGRTGGRDDEVGSGVEHRWVSLPELPAIDFPPANEPITAAIVDRLSARGV